MMSVPFNVANDDSHVLDLIEDMAEQKGWAFTRHDDDTLTFTLKGQSAVYDIELEWQDEFNAIMFSCVMNLPINADQRQRAVETAQRANENLWLGHFDYSDENGRPTFRHTLMLRLVASEVAAEMISDLIELAVAECDRFHTTFSMLSSGDTRMQDALHAAIFETVGEA